MTKTQIDLLGDRLKKGPVIDADLRLLDQYRRSFSNAYETVVDGIRKQLGLNPTGRPAKSTTSIIEKLNRESIRLTQIQDIAGCRLVVQNIFAQDKITNKISTHFNNVKIVDRRDKPSYGYRAVHLIVKHCDKVIEIQIRTQWQHLWAELSEKFSDVVDPMIKYGGGDENIRNGIMQISQSMEDFESAEKNLGENYDCSDQLSEEVNKAVLDLADLKQKLTYLLENMIAILTILHHKGMKANKNTTLADDIIEVVKSKIEHRKGE
jgi:putative GTP pyrophosphokinase